MTEFVRVHDRQVNADRTIPAHVAAAKKDRYQVLDKPALDRNGRPRPTKPRGPIAKPQAAAPAAPTAPTQRPDATKE